MDAKKPMDLDQLWLIGSSKDEDVFGKDNYDVIAAADFSGDPLCGAWIADNVRRVEEEEARLRKHFGEDDSCAGQQHRQRPQVQMTEDVQPPPKQQQQQHSQQERHHFLQRQQPQLGKVLHTPPPVVEEEDKAIDAGGDVEEEEQDLVEKLRRALKRKRKIIRQLRRYKKYSRNRIHLTGV